LYFKLLFPYLKTIPRKCFCQTVSYCVVKDMFSQNTKLLLLNIAFYIKHGGLKKSFPFFFSTYKVSAVDESFLNEEAEVTITKLGSTSSYNDWMKFTELWTKAKKQSSSLRKYQRFLDKTPFHLNLYWQLFFCHESHIIEILSFIVRLESCQGLNPVPMARWPLNIWIFALTIFMRFCVINDQLSEH